jgi:hypothetical protein
MPHVSSCVTLVSRTGLEPAFSCLKGKHPSLDDRERIGAGRGIEPHSPIGLGTPLAASMPDQLLWWARMGSNHLPLLCQSSALPMSYAPDLVPSKGIKPFPPRCKRGVLSSDAPDSG